MTKLDAILTTATILGGISALWFFWDKIAVWMRGDVEINRHDVELYDAYRALFTLDGAADFYRQHDFLAAFPQGRWSPLSRYVDTWDNVEHEFSDARLQEAHRKVYAAALKLGETIARNTVPIGDGSLRSVKPDHLSPGPTPENIKVEAKEINDAVPAFVDAHRAFVKLADRRLRRQRG